MLLYHTDKFQSARCVVDMHVQTNNLTWGRSISQANPRQIGSTFNLAEYLKVGI